MKDRSIYVKLAAVSGVLRCSFLRTPEVKQQLQRVLAMKSIAKDEYAVKQFQGALNAFALDAK